MQTNGKTRMTRWFFFRGSRACQHASLRCVDRSLVGSTANWHHPLSPYIGHRKNLPTSEGSSMTRSTRVALCSSRRVSTIPLTITSPEHRVIFFVSFDEDHHQTSRRWQPLRVTSTIALQLDHLVSLDAISRCNRTRIALTLNQMITIKRIWVRGLLSTPTQATKA
jgi:hypothetical protein